MKNPEKELAEIKSMMERSTRFLSLSGLSGILIGTYALVAAGLVYYWVYYPNRPFDYGMSYGGAVLSKLITTALLTLGLSLGSAWVLSRMKSKRTASRLWTSASKRFVKALFVPLLAGGFFSLALLSLGHIVLVAPVMLTFYGLALVHASHFTLGDIKYLGYCQLILGIVSAFFPGYGLVLWALGFGLLHIIYGTVMYLKYDR